MLAVGATSTRVDSMYFELKVELDLEIVDLASKLLNKLMSSKTCLGATLGPRSYDLIPKTSLAAS